MTVEDALIEWEPKLKTYPHFDSPITKEVAENLVRNPDLVAKHIFFPFLSYSKSIKKFNGEKAKERLIRYAARKDSYIYSYYRSILLKKYNDVLKNAGLEECVIAYRKIKSADPEKGKSNIHFAHEAFEEIKRRGNCIAIAFDISKFFESLDHSLIKSQWKNILGVESLTDDHQRVFRNITNYKVVDLESCYKELGLLEIVDGKKVYKFSKKDQKKKLCSLEDFQKKVVKLIRGNPYLTNKDPNKIEKRGIPQGSPISDVIANMCMLDFDKEIKKLSDELGAYYRRYSDDILLVIPLDNSLLKRVKDRVSSLIKEQGRYLKINDSKTIVSYFSNQNGGNKHETFDNDGKPKNNSFEYLGYGFNGYNPLIKPQTITNYYKKINNGVKAYVRRTYDKVLKDDLLKSKFNPETHDSYSFLKEACNTKGKLYFNVQYLHHKYGKPNKNWRDKDNKVPSNFTTYVKRSSQLMDEPKLLAQIRNNKVKIATVFEKELRKCSKEFFWHIKNSTQKLNSSQV